MKEALKPPPPEEPAGVRLKPFPPESLAHFRISGDSRKVFETIAQLAGLNVAFTHDFGAQAHPISLNLSNVKLEDALQIAAVEANVFWKPITPNTILIIPDNPTNRRIYEEEVLKTFHLANPLSATDQTQLSSALKQVLGLRAVINNAGANSIIVRDTPDKVAAASQLIHSLDLDHAEILIDITVLEANRDRIRDLGISPAPITGNTQVAIGFTPRGSTPATSGGTTVTPLPLNKLYSLKTQDFSIVLPGAIANAVLSDAQTHILESPEVRVTDGQKATLRIGSRVPYATGSFLPSFGGVTGGGTTGAGLGLLASTQFQYQDVGVNLDITPHLNGNGEVSLHAKIEISSVGAPVTLGGLNEPSFNQRIIEHDIQLKEGEVSILGGLIQTQEARTVSGLPGLGDIPVLRYFFSTESKEITKNEVLIMLT
ncbi:MAG: type II secretion system protein GspD, partial [Gammaproteobacteria bacterium]